MITEIDDFNEMLKSVIGTEREVGVFVMRIENHPIIHDFKKGRIVTFSYDDRQMEGYEGEPIAMALKANGVLIHRTTRKNGDPRGMFCAIGRCTDCVMVVNGRPNVRTCVTQLEDGMTVETQRGI